MQVRFAIMCAPGPADNAMMWLLLLCVALASSVAALPALAASPQVQVPLTVAKGVPLRVKLQKRVRIGEAGVPVKGRLTAPVYVYDRVVIPAGAEVTGRVTQVKSASKMVRTRAIMNGSFTPLRTAQVEFDTLVLSDGTRIPISTGVAPDAGPVIQLVNSGNDPAPGLIAQGEQKVLAEKDAVVSAIRKPDKIARLKKEIKTLAVSKIPYHRQYFPSGTVFTAELDAPLSFGAATLPASELAHVGDALPQNSVVHARLVTPLDSATARQGEPVSAVVTQPVFSTNGELLVPQGSRLDGAVSQAKAARWLHRNGKLLFAFHRIDLPHARPEVVEGSVAAVRVAEDSNLQLDAEGGVEPKHSKKKYIAPALSLFVAVQAATPDRDAVSGDIAGAAVPGQGGLAGKVLAGGWGFGLVGSVLSLAVKSRAMTASLGFYGAALSIYSNLLARGQNVDFPVNTPMEIQLGARGGP